MSCCRIDIEHLKDRASNQYSLSYNSVDEQLNSVTSRIKLSSEINSLGLMRGPVHGHYLYRL